VSSVNECLFFLAVSLSYRNARNMTTPSRRAPIIALPHSLLWWPLKAWCGKLAEKDVMDLLGVGAEVDKVVLPERKYGHYHAKSGKDVADRRWGGNLSSCSPKARGYCRTSISKEKPLLINLKIFKYYRLKILIL
jgi:hypothetical protein